MRRVVHCYYVNGENRTTLVIHYSHKMYVPPKDTRMKTGDDVQIRHNQTDDTILVDELFSDPKRVSFKQFDAEKAETWTLRTDI